MDRGELNESETDCNLIESPVVVMDHPMLFPEKLWIAVGIGALIGLAIVIWRAQIKKRRMRNL